MPAQRRKDRATNVIIGTLLCMCMVLFIVGVSKYAYDTRQNRKYDVQTCQVAQHVKEEMTCKPDTCGTSGDDDQCLQQEYTCYSIAFVVKYRWSSTSAELTSTIPGDQKYDSEDAANAALAQHPVGIRSKCYANRRDKDDVVWKLVNSHTYMVMMTVFGSLSAALLLTWVAVYFIKKRLRALKTQQNPEFLRMPPEGSAQETYGI